MQLRVTQKDNKPQLISPHHVIHHQHLLAPSSLCGLPNHPSTDSTELPSVRLSCVLHAVIQLFVNSTRARHKALSHLKWDWRWKIMSFLLHFVNNCVQSGISQSSVFCCCCQQPFIHLDIHGWILWHYFPHPHDKRVCWCPQAKY